VAARNLAQYQITIDSQERFQLIVALATRIGVTPTMKELEYTTQLALIQKLVALEPMPLTPEPAGDRALADSRRKTQNSPPASIPYDSKALIVDVDSVFKSKDGDRLTVKWAGGQANCWVPELFPKVLGTVKQRATFYVREVRKEENVYLNILGVK
jgi:hypothetical protein